ncbi:lysin A N-acetylmuramoyl-L-alanine amidase domain [Arthrobacter phage Casserole]|nr:lysin A N-acetylmuramoyl-L-alanine amidase domain [Arthrobacter phage Casserole]
MGYYLADNPNPNAGQFVTQRRGIYGQLSGTVIMHTAEGYGAASVAGFIARREDYGSYHRLVDPNTIIEMAHWEWETWQDSETNNWAVGISAACRAADWLGIEIQTRLKYYRNLAICAADFVRYMRENYGIEVPRVRISGAQARARVPGFCAHGDSGLSRHDPGVDFDWETFFAMTNEELGEEEDMAISEERFAALENTVKNISDGLFNNNGKNASILGGLSVPGLINKNDVEGIRVDNANTTLILNALKEVSAKLDTLIKK